MPIQLSTNMPISNAEVAYWVTWAIPVVLVALGIAIHKIVSQQPWNRTHFYIGLDLTVYFLAACLTNLIDLSRTPERQNRGYLFTVGLVAVGVVLLFFQTAFHAEWENKENLATGQLIWLCGISNSVGLFLLYCFVRLKIKGLI